MPAKAFLRPICRRIRIYTSNVGSVVGTHTGPGGIAIAYIQQLPGGTA